MVQTLGVVAGATVLSVLLAWPTSKIMGEIYYFRADWVKWILKWDLMLSVLGLVGLWAHSQYGDSMLPVAGVGAVAVAMESLLWIAIDRSRDFSGGSASSARGYWATQDGARYMSASKAQTGEWQPPYGTTKMTLVVNLVLGFVTWAASQFLHVGQLDERVVPVGVFLGLVAVAALIYKLLEVEPGKRSGGYRWKAR